VGGSVPDLIAPGLRVLFCGINPSLYSAAVGHHFARPGNRFWRTIFRAGFTDRLLAPHEGQHLLASGIGITNVVRRATASADELVREDYATGARALRRKLLRYQPRVIAFLGVTTCHPRAGVGHQAERFAGVDVWALPNPSGLNAHYSVDALVACYASLRSALPERS
jgi:TDG/mug DNA glycosylase family protein